jgi:hypothetical protein
MLDALEKPKYASNDVVGLAVNNHMSRLPETKEGCRHVNKNLWPIFKAFFDIYD